MPPRSSCSPRAGARWSASRPRPSCARPQRAAAPSRPAEGRVPGHGQPRAAHAPDLDPVVLRILLDTPDLNAEERARFLLIIVRESERLTRRINDFLDL